MYQTLKRFVKLTVGYSPITLLGPLLTIFLVPLYTRVLEPADYGVVDVALTFSSFFTIFAVTGMDRALEAYFFGGDIGYRRNLVTSAIICVSVIGLVVGVGIIITAKPMAQFLFKDPTFNSVYHLYVLALNAVTVPVYSLVSAALRLQMDVKRVNALGLAYLGATIIGNILLVLVFHLGGTGIILANVLTNLGAAGLGLILASDFLRGRFLLPLIKPVIRAGVGLLPGAVSVLLLMSVDRLLLTQSVSPHDLGLYSIANKLASMLSVFFAAAWSAWWPLALEMAAQPAAPRQYARMFEYFVAGSMLLSLSIGLFAPEILTFFTRSMYVPAAPYVLMLTIYFGPISAAFGSFQLALYITKRTDLLSFIFIISAVINVVLNLLLNPFIGVWGAVWATVLAGAVLVMAAYFLGQRLFFVPYHLPRFFSLLIVYLGLITTFLFVAGLNILPFKLGALLVFIGVILTVGVVPRHHVQLGLQTVWYGLNNLVGMRLR